MERILNVVGVKASIGIAATGLRWCRRRMTSAQRRSPWGTRFRFHLYAETDPGKGTSKAVSELVGYPHHVTRDFHTDEDYAVISRAFLPQTHSMLILISGCTQYGTEGAADLITNPELLAGALREAPAGWQHKNLQLVLFMQVIANAPASPKVVAAHYW